MYFPLLILHSWGKRSAAQPQAIYSEVPFYTRLLLAMAMNGSSSTCRAFSQKL